jgi:hypothetical protein
MIEVPKIDWSIRPRTVFVFVVTAGIMLIAMRAVGQNAKPKLREPSAFAKALDDIKFFSAHETEFLEQIMLPVLGEQRDLEDYRRLVSWLLGTTEKEADLRLISFLEIFYDNFSKEFATGEIVSRTDRVGDKEHWLTGLRLQSQDKVPWVVILATVAREGTPGRDGEHAEPEIYSVRKEFRYSAKKWELVSSMSSPAGKSVVR